MDKSQTKICQNCESSFAIEPDDFAFYEKMNVPAPALCSDCRMKRKLVWRNERTLYKRICDLCGKSIIAIYNPSYTAPIYCFDCSYSDKWDPWSYGFVYNPELPFFQQFKELLSRMPKAATHIGTGDLQNVNSEYVNFAGGNKDCHLLFNSTKNENCSYCRGVFQSRDSLDLYFNDQAELCYEGVNVNRSNSVFWSQNSSNCLNSYFLLDCLDCQNCFGCVNLRHKSYYFWNEPLLKEEWNKRVSEVLGNYYKMEETKTKFKEFSLNFPSKENNNLKAVNCSNNYIFESKNCTSCFEVFCSENCKYSIYVKLLKDGYDNVGRGVKSELLLETLGVGHGCSRVIGTWTAENSHDIEYSFDLRACSNCFGCVGLKHAEYCILNHKYSENDYHILRQKIIAELKKDGAYGLYMPPELSPWSYNETLAQENYPLTKEEAKDQGFRWEDNIPRSRNKETLKIEDIPNNIKDAKDDICNEILKCIECGYNYKLIRSELDFYKQMNIPIPRKCFNCRHDDRLKLRGPMVAYDRKCDKCGRDIKTFYAPDRPEIIYCESCYNNEVA